MKKLYWVLLLFLAILCTVLIFLNESIFTHSLSELNKHPIRPKELNHRLMKPKLIWLMFDAYATYQAGDLADYSNFSSFYHIRNQGYPQSASIASSQLLGRASRNYVGELITEDTIIDQLVNYPTSVVSAIFPIINILGESRFRSVIKYRGREKYPMFKVDYFAALSQFIYHARSASNLSEANQIVTETSDSILTQLNEFRILDLLNSWTEQKSKNFIVYTSIMDSYNHNYAGLHEKTLVGAAMLLADVKGIIKAFEASEYKDEYVLVVSSDHGGQIYFGEDEVCNHGCQMDRGNEGFLYVYSYGTDKREGWIGNDDVAAIIAGYLTDAAIPPRSTGWPKPIKDNGICYVDEMRWNSLKLKEFQLASLLGYEVDDSEMTYDEFLVYVRELEMEVFQREKMTYLFIILSCFGVLITWKMFKLINLEIFFFLFEHIFVFFLARKGRRIELLLYYPVLLLNIFILISNLYKYPLSKLQSNSFSLKLTLHKLKELLQTNQSISIASITLYFLISLQDKFNATQIYTYYYIHYTAFLALLLYYFSTTSKKFKTTLSILTVFLLSLMLLYEHITDYSMTDQTEAMIITVRIYYLSLIALTLFIIATPDKRKILPVPLALLYFFIANQEQRLFFVLFFLPSVYFLTLSGKISELLTLGISSYLIMLGTFGFDISLRAGNHSWGVIPDDFPVFTGFLFGVHKFSWLMIAGCGVMASDLFDEYFLPLLLKGLMSIIVFLYLFFSDPDSALAAFMWCMGQNLMMIVSHSLGIVPEFKFRVRLKLELD